MERLSLEVFGAYSRLVQFSTNVVLLATGKEQRHSRWQSPRRTWTLTVKRDPDILAYLRAFFQARKGAYESFEWADPSGIIRVVRFGADEFEVAVWHGRYGTVKLELIEVGPVTQTAPVPMLASFSRATQAMTPPGHALVESGVPRFVPGPDAIYLEETENLLGTVGGGASTDWTKWSHWGSATYWYSFEQYDDPQMGKVFRGTSKDPAYVFDYAPYNWIQGTKYLFAIFIRADRTIPGKSMNFYMTSNVGGQHLIASATQYPNITTQWQKAWAVLTPTESTPAGMGGFGINFGGGNDGIQWEFALPMVAPNKDRDVPFAATTRAARWEPGPMGMGLLIERGLENLVQNPGFTDFVTNPTGTIGWDDTLNGTSTPSATGYSHPWGNGYNSGLASAAVGFHAHLNPKGGPSGGPCFEFIDENAQFGYPHRWMGTSQYLKSTSEGGAAALGWTDGTRVTISFDVKYGHIDKALQAGLYHTRPDGTLSFGTAITNVYADPVCGVGRWHRRSATFTLVGADWDFTKGVTLYLYGNYGRNSNPEGRVWVDNIQVQTRACSDSYHGIAGSRAGESLSIPTPTAGEPFTLDIDVCFSPESLTVITNYYGRVFQFDRNLAGGAGLIIAHSHSLQRWSLESYNDAGQSRGVGFDDIMTPAGRLTRLTVSMDATEALMLVNNIQVGRIQAPNIPSTYAKGWLGGPTQLSGAVYFGARLRRGKHTALTDYNKPLGRDENTIWLLPLYEGTIAAITEQDTLGIPAHAEHQRTDQFSTLITPPESGAEARRAQWNVSRRKWALTFEKDPQVLERLMTFFEARRGAYEAFWWYDPEGAKRRVRFASDQLQADISYGGYGKVKTSLIEVI